MLTTADDEVAAEARRLALHGISSGAAERYTPGGSWYYEILEPGFKYNMTDIAAALGIVQLSRLPRMLERRQAIADRYDEAFAALPQLEIPPRPPSGEVHARHLYPLRTVPAALALDRNGVVEALRSRGVGTSVHFIPLHLHPYYRDTYGYVRGDFPVAEDFYDRCVSLPLYPAMTDDEVERVVAAVAEICEEYAV
jgi:perosamine synthetase